MESPLRRRGVSGPPRLGMPKEAEHYFNQSLALVAVNINNASLDNLGGRAAKWDIF